MNTGCTTTTVVRSWYIWRIKNLQRQRERKWSFTARYYCIRNREFECFQLYLRVSEFCSRLIWSFASTNSFVSYYIHRQMFVEREEKKNFKHPTNVSNIRTVISHILSRVQTFSLSTDSRGSSNVMRTLLAAFDERALFALRRIQFQVYLWLIPLFLCLSSRSFLASIQRSFTVIDKHASLGFYEYQCVFFLVKGEVGESQ